MTAAASIPRVLFWIALGQLLYTYVAYPLLLFAAAGLRQLRSDLAFAWRRRERRQRASAAFRPEVSLVFSAHNEQDVIEEKMRSCAQLDYPAERTEVLVGCDGCSDRTGELARSVSLPNARVFEFPERAGKLSVLNRLVREARGEIVVFSDASSLLRADAIRMLVRHFEDSRVGCACGEMRLRSSGGAAPAEGAYWRYEFFLKLMESRLNLLLGASGCIYAIRRELYSSFPPKAINEDFLLPMFIRAAGYRLVFDPEAVAYEEPARDVRQEFRRHVRIGAGNFHALRFTARFLNPAAGWVAFSYWSHKVLRWLAPFALLAAFFSSLVLSAEPFYRVFVAASVAMAALSVFGYRRELRGLPGNLLSVPYYFVSLHLALLVGFVRFLNGRQTAVWEPVALAAGNRSETAREEAR